MSGCCDDKVFEGMSDGYKRALLAVILINAVMFFVEITAGLKSGSQALLADSLDFGVSPACGAIIIPSQNNKYLKRQRLYLSRSLYL